MNKPKPKKITNKKLSDPEWYVALSTDILDLKFATLAKDLGKALNPEVEDTASELLSVYLQAFRKALSNLNINVEINLDANKKKLFFEQVLDPNFPSYHPIFMNMSKIVEYEYLTQNTTQFEQTWTVIRESLRQEFSINFNSIIQSGMKEYTNANEYIKNLSGFIEPKESQAIAHMNIVLDELENEALAIDPELTLRKSYVTPSCTSKLDTIHKSNNKLIKNDNIILTLLDKIKSSSYPIIIHGQPGHGKTSTVKVLVSALTQSFRSNDLPLSVLFYEFKNLRALNDPILKVLNSETPFVESDDYFVGKNTVMILDGLDERQITDGSDDTLKSFVSGLFRLADRINNKLHTKLNLILTGRSQYVGQIKTCFNTDHLIFEIEDFSKEKIGLWLKRFHQQKPTDESITLDKLNMFNLQELISQPILLAISAIMLCDNDGKKLLSEFDGSNINRTQIYEIIIRWSYEKKWQKMPTRTSINGNLSFDDYLSLLQAIAFEMFKEGKESIKLSNLATSLKNSIFDLEFLSNKTEDHIEELCSQLRISFFFKGVEDKAFSFLHKSIKDFLIVTGLIDSLITLIKMVNIKKVDREASDLYKLLGERALSNEDHIPMLNEWLEEKNEELYPYKKELLAIWEKVGTQDFNISYDTPSQLIQSQYNITYNYYQIISRHFSSNSTEQNKEIFNHEKVILFSTKNINYSFVSFCNFYNYLLIDRSFNHGLCFKNQYIANILSFPEVNMGKNDFTNCLFNNVHFFPGNFYHCVFSGVEITNCWIGNSTFTECDFKGSIIDSISTNTGHDSYPKELIYFNKFFKCDFSFSNLSGNYQDDYFHEMQFLFWNCNFKSTNFDCWEVSTVKYDEEFNGIKLESE
ncbi:hypothetical protein AWH60_09655 [Pseudoalteromonas haloplanktis]|nr:hypothetical protein AWH60_09655 [Pseudoalteromonas haloplanktis]